MTIEKLSLEETMAVYPELLKTNWPDIDTFCEAMSACDPIALALHCVLYEDYSPYMGEPNDHGTPCSCGYHDLYPLRNAPIDDPHDFSSIYDIPTDDPPFVQQHWCGICGGTLPPPEGNKT